MSFESFPLDYSVRWLELGIVDVAGIQRDEQECRKGDDPHPEHYRWRAFCRFLDAQRSLAPQLAHQLYSLGEADADCAMGGSIMTAVLRHPNCPAELLQHGLGSERPYVRRLAAKRIGSNG